MALQDFADLADILNLNEFAQWAAKRLAAATFGYYEGGTADNITRDENIAAFQRLRDSLPTNRILESA